MKAKQSRKSKKITTFRDLQKQISELDAELYDNTLQRIINEPELRDRLEMTPAKTLEELGFKLSRKEANLLKGKRLSEVMMKEFPDAFPIPALGPIAIAGVAILIFSPAVYAGVRILIRTRAVSETPTATPLPGEKSATAK